MEKTTDTTEATPKTAAKPRVRGMRAAAPAATTTSDAAHLAESFAELEKTPWKCEKTSDLPGSIRALRLDREIAINESEYRGSVVIKTCSMLGTEDPNLIEEKLQLVLSRKDELDKLTRNAQLCLLPQWRPAKRENLAEAVTNLCDSWSANVDRIRDMEQKGADLKREYELLSKQRDAIDADREKWRKAALKAEEQLRDTTAAMHMAAEEAERLRPVLPFWARALAGVVWTATVFLIAHKMGFEAHAIIGGGK